MVGRTVLRAFLVAATVLATAGAVTAAPAPASEPGGGLARLSVAHRAIVDDQGRSVLLRGVNLNHLVDYAQNRPPLPTVMPASDADFAQMASLGFNVVRLNISWSKLEPTRGAFDRGYVARIRHSVDAAKAHGIYTVLDMHQDAWGPSIGSPRGVVCPPGSEPGVGWDGAPAWATITDGWSTCAIGGQREAAPAVARVFQNF